MKQTKPLLVIEVPLHWSSEELERLSDALKSNVEGYQIISMQRDIEDYNLIF